MGDLVRSIMEAMVPDIVSLVKRKVFTRKEAKQILKAREAAEYAFLKKNATQKEYLKAIQYEYDLERTRRERFKELKLKKSKHTDFSILRRIIYIFDRLTAKYRDNIELWKEYCLFCYKIKSNKMFYKAISNAMSMNWNSLDIWLLAVYYQVEMNNNPFKARKIFLKGLKMNPERRVYNQFFPHDKDFWLEYFRFELKFLEIVKKRKEMMGVVDEEPKEGSENNEEGDDDEEVITIQKKPERSDDMMLFEEEKVPVGNDKTAELAVLVYETIIENFPTDAKLTSDILNICSEFDNEWIESLKEKIVGIHKEKYTQNPVANLKVLLEVNRIKSAAFQEDDITDIEARFKVLIESLEENFKQQEENNEDEEKVEEYKAAVILELQKSLDSLFSYIKQLRQDHSENFGTFFSLIITSLLPQNFNNQRYFPFFNGICDFISNTGSASDALISFLRTFYEQEKSLNNLSQKDSLYHEILAKIAEVSITHREIEIIKHDKLAKAIREFLKSLKKSVIPHESSSALLYSLAELQSKEITKEEIAWILKQAITHLAYTTEFPAFTRKFISFIITHCGIDDPKTNECMNHLFTLRSACPIDAILVYVEALTRHNPEDPKIKATLKKALDWNQKDKQLWIRLISWEKDFGNPMECPEIFQRAQKIIKDEDFLDIYTTIMQE